MKDQGHILVYAAEQLRDKLAAGLPGTRVALWTGAENEGLVLFPLGLNILRNFNGMETIIIDEQLVPVPRMVSLGIALFPLMEDLIGRLDLSAALIRLIGDNPFIDIRLYNWYGNQDGTALIEFQDFFKKKYVIPEALRPFLPFMREIAVELGINSSRNEPVRRVTQRQFTAAKK